MEHLPRGSASGRESCHTIIIDEDIIVDVSRDAVLDNRYSYLPY